MGTSVRLGALSLVFFLAATVSPLNAEQGFRLADTLVCTIFESNRPAEAGKKIMLQGLTTGAPQAVYENHVRAAMLKVFESDRTIVLQLVAAVSGSVDTIVIDAVSGHFAHTAAGVFLDVHAIAETGSCRPE
jgi:hypothetical protein